MIATELFASEWRILQEKRQQLVSDSEELKRRLISVTSEPEMKKLLEEKDRIKKEIPEIRKEIERHGMVILGRQNFLDRRRKAVTDKRLQKEFTERLRTYQQRLPKLEKLDAPRAILENERRMIFELEAPIEEVEKSFRKSNAEEEQKQKEAERVLNDALARIAMIRDHYRQTVKSLEVAIRETEQRRQQYCAEEIEWGTQSRVHLEWMLKNQSSYKDDLIRRYKVRFPTDNLLDLFPPLPISTPIASKSNGKKRRSKPLASLSPVAEDIPVTHQAWRFWVTFNANDTGQELSVEKDSFLGILQSALDKATYFSLDVRLAYDKLLAVTKMSKQQRQEMNKIVRGELLGWKILRLGKKHRFFLLIDEDKRHIRFLPRQRKKSYSHH
jgi:hypothetical protein